MEITFRTALSKMNAGSFIKKMLTIVTCLMIASVMNVYAQTTALTGTVVDEFGDPLIGVSIQIEGTTSGTVTDIDGKYTVNVKANDVLVYTYVGMASQKVKFANQKTLDIVLKEDATVLTETVVIGYGSAKKRDLTGSIVRVDARDIKDKPASNPLAAIQGKVSGVQIINSGRAGQDPEIRIRGVNSIDGYKPLYVVDGLFADNINYLNPSDIETMDVLKDPSSLAIFGIRGANGVIIITTKRAKEGQTIVSLNSSMGWKHVAKRMDMANAEQFKLLYNEQLRQQKADPFDYTGWGADTDWQDAIFQTGFMTNNNVSITGSSTKNKFYLGVGYQSEEGIIQTEKYNRVTINLNSDYTVTDWMRFGFQVNGARMLPPDAKNVDNAIKAAPIAPIYGNYLNPETNQYEQLNQILPSFQSAQLHNPMMAIDLQGQTNKAYNYRGAGNIYGEVDFLKDFKFKTTFSFDLATNDRRQMTPVLWVFNPETGNKENLNNGQSVEQEKTHSVTAQQDYILTYNKNINRHSVTAMGGITTNYLEYSGLKGYRSQQVDDGIDFYLPNDADMWWLSSLPSLRSTNSSDQYRKFTMSYLLRGLYSYDNKYLLNASIRRDGTSLFKGTDNVWGTFYTIGGGWVVSQEKFMQNIKQIDYLKLKGSYGVLGSENTGGERYPTYPTLGDPISAVFGDQIYNGYGKAYQINRLGWEKTYAWEVGMEITALNQRLTLEPTYYHKRTDGIIVMIDGMNGQAKAMQNMGEIENKGWELSGTWNDKIGGTGIGYRLSGNLTTLNNKVLSIGDGPDYTIYKENAAARTRAGYPIGHFYGYKVTGVYQNTEDIAQSPQNGLSTVKPGDLKFADINGDGVINIDDRTMIGNPMPDFTYGFTVGLDYKGFDVSIDMMGVYGNEIYRKWDTSEYAQFNYRADRMNRWNGEGTSNWEPILDTGRSINRQNSSYFIEDGSYFRIRNIQLGYTFDAKLLSKIYLKSLRLFGNIQNPKTWSKNSGYTPEISGGAMDSGFDKGTYPVPVVYTFGLNVTF